MKKLLLLLLLCCSAAFIYFKYEHSSTKSSATNNVAKDELVFGIYPYLEEKTLREKFEPLVDYLAKSLNKKISLEISPSYAEHLNLVGKDYYDFSYVGPSLYIIMVEEYGYKTILASMTTYDLPFFNGIIFVRSDSSIYNLKDLKNKTFAFGKELSTMSSRVPTVMLEEKGIKLKDLKSYQHLNNHEEVAKQVLAGNFSAGAAKEEIYDKYKSQGLREIARSRHVAEHVFIASDSMNNKTQKNISTLLLTITDSKKGKQILFNIKPKSNNLQETQDESFNSLRDYLHIDTNFTWDFEHSKLKNFFSN